MFVMDGKHVTGQNVRIQYRKIKKKKIVSTKYSRLNSSSMFASVLICEVPSLSVKSSGWNLIT
jgi:hypothetical protein